MVIKHKVFIHNGYYFYRLHTLKINNLCNGFSKLNEFLNSLFINCPDEYFTSGPRSSNLKLDLNIHPCDVSGHEISELTRIALKTNYERTDHTKIEVFFLEKDDKTIATEIPLWLKPNELSNFKELFNSTIPLTGHIDILRLEDNKVWVWDYKPEASKQKYAPTQVFFYALMLSKRTNIPLEHFRCGFFDENIAYMFKPEETTIQQEIPLASYV